MVKRPAQDNNRAFCAHEERPSRNSATGQPTLKDTASATYRKRPRIRQFGRRVMLMVKYYSCLGWPFKSQASVWQLSQVDESMVPQSRPSSKNSDRKDDPRRASTDAAKDANSRVARRDDTVDPENRSQPKETLLEVSTSSASSPFADSQTMQQKFQSINCQDKDPQDTSHRSSLQKGVSMKRARLLQPWINTPTLDGIDRTPFFDRQNTNSVEKESSESVFLQAVETPFSGTAPFAPKSLLDCSPGQLDPKAYIDSLFQQAVRTPLPDETDAAQSAVPSKPSLPRLQPRALSLPQPPPLDLSSPNHSISRATHASQGGATTASYEYKLNRLPSLLDPICLTPPAISSSTEGVHPQPAEHSETRPNVPPRTSSRFSLRLRSRFGSNKSTRSKRHDRASQPNDGEPEPLQRPYVTRCDSVLSIQEQVKAGWSRSPTHLPPVELSRGRYKAYVPDFPPLDSSLFVLSPNFDDEVHVAAAVRLPDGGDDDDDDDDLCEEDADNDSGFSPTPTLPHNQSTKALGARALSSRRRSRHDVVASPTRSDSGFGDGDRTSTSTSTSVPALVPVNVGQSILEGVCNRCRAKLASVWSSATVVSA